MSKLFNPVFVAAIAGALLTACSAEPAASDPSEAEAEVAAPETQEVAGPQRTILAFGDSLFAGYNVEPSESYPAQLEQALRADGINARVTNAGVSGDTTAAGAGRIEFTLDSLDTPPDLAIVELGGNDLLRSISPAETRANLELILSELAERSIPTLIMGMRAPPNLGDEFVREFDGIYPQLAEKYGATLVPFFLEPIYDRPEMIQQDRIHPTAEGLGLLVEATADEVLGALPPANDN